MHPSSGQRGRGDRRRRWRGLSPRDASARFDHVRGSKRIETWCRPLHHLFGRSPSPAAPEEDRLPDKPPSQLVRVAHRGGEAGGAHHGRDGAKAREIEREQVTALRGDDGVQLIEDHAPQVGEKMCGIRARQQQRQLFRRRQQDIGRVHALPLALGDRRVAGTRLDANAEAQIRHGTTKIALDVDGECLQRRNIERVQPRAVRRLGEFHEARQEAGQRLAGAGWRNQQRVLAALGGGEKIELMLAWRPPARCEPGLEDGGQQRCRGGARRLVNRREAARREGCHRPTLATACHRHQTIRAARVGRRRFAALPASIRVGSYDCRRWIVSRVVAFHTQYLLFGRSG